MSPDFHKFWLKITAVVVGIAGPIFFLGTIVSTSEPARLTPDILRWPLDGTPSFAAPTTRFLSALTGGFLLGWSVLFWSLSTKVYDFAPEQVRQSTVLSLLAWFALDSAGSILSGNASNAGFNVLVLLLAVGPLWRPAKA